MRKDVEIPMGADARIDVDRMRRLVRKGGLVPPLKKVEIVVLTASLLLADEAEDGVFDTNGILTFLEICGSDVGMSPVYGTMNDLVKRGLIVDVGGRPSDVSGRRTRMFVLHAKGRDALRLVVLEQDLLSGGPDGVGRTE